MPNLVHNVVSSLKDHFTADDNDIYVYTIDLIHHIANELDRFEYETNSDGEAIYADLVEAIADWKAEQKQDEDKEDETETDDDEVERVTEDDDEVPSTST